MCRWSMNQGLVLHLRSPGGDYEHTVLRYTTACSLTNETTFRRKLPPLSWHVSHAGGNRFFWNVANLPNYTVVISQKKAVLVLDTPSFQIRTPPAPHFILHMTGHSTEYYSAGRTVQRLLNPGPTLPSAPTQSVSYLIPLSEEGPTRIKFWRVAVRKPEGRTKCAHGQKRRVWRGWNKWQDL